MTIEILIQIVLLGIGLSMDAFSVAIVDGLTMKDINKKRSLFIAGSFGFMQALMPLLGFFVIELIQVLLGEFAGNEASIIASKVVVWLAFALLLFVGIKMLVEAIKEMKLKEEEKKEKFFSYKDVILFSFITSIDAFAAGITMHSGLSIIPTVFLHVSIIFFITFIISLIGIILSKQIVKLLKGKTEVTGIIGGIILIILSLWVLLSHYYGV